MRMGRAATWGRRRPSIRVTGGGAVLDRPRPENNEVLAARLTATLAVDHGLAALAADVDYYTGPIPIDDPLLACFEVEKVLPLDLARLARHFRDCLCGALEIKVRGVEHEPEEVRRRLKLRGENSATLILTRLSRKRLAIVARRISNSCPVPHAPCTRPPAHATCV